MAYYFRPKVSCTVLVSLCGSASLPSSFDTKLFVLQNVDDGGSLNPLACDDNGCGDKLSSLTVRAGGGGGGRGRGQDGRAGGR